MHHPTLDLASPFRIPRVPAWPGGWRGPERGPLAVRSSVLVLLAAALLLAAGGGDGALARGRSGVVTRGPGDQRTIALTFDDGWDAARCERMADTLTRLGVPATWFPNGVYVRRAPNVWRRIAARFPMGSHTFDHRALTGMSARGIRRDLSKNERVIRRATGRPLLRMLRPSYGAYDSRVVRAVRAAGYERVVLWDISSGDTSREGTDRSVARRALRGRPGSIILMHCGPEVTPRILPIVVARYACAGYRFATLPDLLAGRPGSLARVPCPPPPIPAGRTGLQADDPSPSSGAPASSPLLDQEWRLTHVLVDEALVPAPPGATLSVRFGERLASGSVDCDVFSVRFVAQDDGSLSFDDPARGVEECADRDAPSAAGFLDDLLASVGYRVSGDELDLLDGAGVVRLRFLAGEPTGLPGSWTVTAIKDGLGPLGYTGVDPGLKVVFGPTGTVRGTAGCDSYVGGYSYKADTLAIGPLVAGTATCGPVLDALQERFLGALRGVAGWRLAGDHLALLDADDQVVLELAPRPRSTPEASSSPGASTRPDGSGTSSEPGT